MKTMPTMTAPTIGRTANGQTAESQTTSNQPTARSETVRLTLTIDDTAYTVRRLDTSESPYYVDAYELKRRGAATLIVTDSDDGPVCGCREFDLHHVPGAWYPSKPDGCRHIRAIRAVGMF